MLEGKAYMRWRSTPLCWLNNVAQVASLHLCPGLLSSDTAVNPPAQSRNFTIKMQQLWTTVSVCQQACNKRVSEWLTYLVGSSRFWSFILAGIICVAWGPEAYGWGSCPLNSDWMKCSCQLEIRKRKYQQVTQSLLEMAKYTFLILHWRLVWESWILTCAVEGSCLGSGTTLCPHTH